VINISNYVGKDNPRGGPAPAGRTGAPSESGGPRRSKGLKAASGSGGRPGARERAGLRRVWEAFALAVGIALDWLAYFLRRWGDRRFAVADTEAYWWGWQISKTHGGLGRCYHNSRFDTLAACARCAGAGVWRDAPCGPCLGTGRISLGEVS
jgi:hypothetical protein